MSFPGRAGIRGRVPIRVLVIDDEEPIRLLCRVNLEAEGMIVLEASDGLSGLALARAGIVLGKTYPKPIVDHAAARSRALAAFAEMRDAR